MKISLYMILGLVLMLATTVFSAESMRTIRGKAVLASDSGKTVPKVGYRFQSSDLSGMDTDRKQYEADENGTFQITVPNVPLTLELLVPGQAGKIVIVQSNENEITVPLEPLGAITGKIVDKETRKPIAGKNVEAFVPVESYQGRFFRCCFLRETQTDSQGMYSFENLPTGTVFHIQAKKSCRGEPEENGNGDEIAKIEPKPGETLRIDDFRYNSAPQYYEEYLWVFFNAPNRACFEFPKEKKTLDKRFEVVLKRCKRDHKNMIAVFAQTENNSPDKALLADWCKMMYTDKEVFVDADQFYLTAFPTDEKTQDPSDSKYSEYSRDFAKKHQIASSALDAMTLCFFDADGKLLATESALAFKEPKFSESGKLDFKLVKPKLIDLLKKYEPAKYEPAK